MKEIVIFKMNINEAKIKCSIKEGIEFLKKIDVFEEYVMKNCEILEYEKKYSETFRRSVYDKDYETIYKNAMMNSDYDILLKDGSFFQFNFKKENRNNFKLKYNFFPNPYIDSVSDYKNFVKEMYRQNYEEVGEEYRDFYEQYISESTADLNITPIRYDYDKNSYLNMCHPISHLHIGKNENVRLPINYVLLPEMFIQNTIMLLYFEDWKKNINEDDIKNKCFFSKIKSKRCENDILNEEEQKIIYLN